MNTFEPSYYSSHEGPMPIDIPTEGNFGDLGSTVDYMPLSNDDFGMLIAEENPANSWLLLAQTVAGGAAAALSYKKNRSVLWALGAWFIWPAALPYYLITKEG